MINGGTVDTVKDKCARHNNVISATRIGDTLVRSCGDTWPMKGRNGGVFLSESNKVRVTRILSDAKASVTCAVSGKFGDIDLVNFLYTTDITQ